MSEEIPHAGIRALLKIRPELHVWVSTPIIARQPFPFRSRSYKPCWSSRLTYYATTPEQAYSPREHQNILMVSHAPQT